MITAVDTNVLLDVFANDPQMLTRDRGFYRRCFQQLAILDPSR